MADNPTPPPLPNVAPARTSAMAVTSLVLGILGLFTCGITALFGLAFGIIGLVKVKGSQGKLKGDGLALAGIIVSAVFLLALPIFAAMLLPVLAAAKQRAQTINCMSNEKQLALAIQIYAQGHSNHFPAATNWCDAIKSTVTPNVFKCPAANPASQCDYAFNAALGGMEESQVDPHTVMLFESDAGWDASGGPELMAAGRHQRGNLSIVAFADGSVQEVRESGLNNLRWNP
jgi:prepilin-type processing-associated H-X9-DG protein